ncbi:hypothetical protein BC828DRAFT_377718 [Blastocladiella britannica]|nr:hypothetical protein BC828DRAFT_377718 [Blastocladiella britannica]
MISSRSALDANASLASIDTVDPNDNTLALPAAASSRRPSINLPASAETSARELPEYGISRRPTLGSVDDEGGMRLDANGDPSEEASSSAAAPLSKNWSKLKKALIPEKKINVFEIFGGGKNKLTAIPYTMTLSQGIYFKYRVHPSKRPVVCGHIHERMQVGGTAGARTAHSERLANARGRAGGGGSGGDSGKGGAADDSGSDTGSDIDNVEDSIDALVRETARGSAVESKGSHGNSGSGSGSGGNASTAKDTTGDAAKSGATRVPLTAVYLDDRNYIVMQDVTRGSAPFRTLVKQELFVELSQFIPVPYHGIYVGCSHDETIKLFNTKFEHIRNVLAWHSVLRVQWIPELMLLAAMGVDKLTFWTMNTHIDRGDTKVNMSQTMCIELDGLERRRASEWIGSLLYEPRNRRFYVTVGPRIAVFSVTGSFMFHIESPFGRVYTCLEFHPELHYLLAGVSDGTIEAWNLNNTLVHTFEGHLKSVTTLARYDGSLLMSGSADGTLRLWNTSTFRLVFTLHIKESITRTQVTDRHQIWIESSRGLSMWTINMLNQSWTHVNSDVIHMQLFKTAGTPPRVLVGSDDGVWRLLSPTSGKVLTTCIPAQHTMKAISVTYSPRTNRLFLLMESGDIWVAATDTNPSVMIEHWKVGGAAHEECGLLCAYDGTTTVADEETKFTFLFGATANGQLVAYNKYGAVSRRFAVHSTAVTHLIADVKSGLLVSAAKDHTVRITQVNPTKKDLLVPKISLSFATPVTTLTTIDFKLLVGCEDGIVSQVNFNLRTGDFRNIPAHARNDDHADLAIVSCGRKRWGLYVTLGIDRVIKVWDSGNVLVREITFDMPPTGLCIASSWMDLLVAWDNRIDLIRYMDYLPPGYAQSIASAFHKSNPPEEALPLEPNQELVRLISRRAIPLPRFAPHLESLNLVPDDSWRPHFSVDKLYSALHEDEDHHVTMPGGGGGNRPWSRAGGGAPLGSLRNNRRGVSTVGSIYSTTQSNMGPRRGRHGMSQMGGFDEDLAPIASQLMMQDTEMVIQVAQPPPPPPHAEDEGDDNHTTAATLASAFSVNDVGDTDLTMPSKQIHVAVVPDGVLPNSRVLAAVDEYQREHDIDQPRGRSLTRKKKKRLRAATADDQERRSVQYKARLQRLLAMLPKPPSPERAAEPLAEEKEEAADEPAKLPRLVRKKGGLPPPPPAIDLPLPLTPPVFDDEPEEEEDLPKLIKKAMEFHFVQEKELFRMKETKSGHVRRELAVEPTPDGMLPLLLRSFDAADTLARKEIADFINWLNDEYDFDHPRQILDMYLRHLHAVFLMPANDLERELILSLLSALNMFGMNDHDVWACLLMYLVYGEPSVEAMARSVLAELGLSEPTYPLLLKRLGDLVTLSKRESEEDGKSTVDIARSYVIGWVRRIPFIIQAGEQPASAPASADGAKATSGHPKRRQKSTKGKKRAASGVQRHDSMEELAKFLKRGNFGTSASTISSPAKELDTTQNNMVVPDLLNAWIQHQIELKRQEEDAKRLAEQHALERNEAERLAAERMLAEQTAQLAKDLMRQDRERAKALEAAQAEAERRAEARRLRLAEREAAAARRAGAAPIKYSRCHPSRESMNYRFTLPPLAMGSAGALDDAESMIGVHLLQLAKSMPMDLINPRPFAKSTRLGLSAPDYRTFTAPTATIGAVSKIVRPLDGGGPSSSSRPGSQQGGDEAMGFTTRKRFLVLDPRAGGATALPHLRSSAGSSRHEDGDHGHHSH